MTLTKADHDLRLSVAQQFLGGGVAMTSKNTGAKIAASAIHMMATGTRESRDEIARINAEAAEYRRQAKRGRIKGGK